VPGADPGRPAESKRDGGQLVRYLRSRCDLPGRPAGLHRPGPLPLRPGDLARAFIDWAAAHAATGVPA
jgi:2-oxoglutarate ferredoxin oxidoreductase subunit alpha